MNQLKALFITTVVGVTFLLAPLYGAAKEGLYDDFWGGVATVVRVYFQAIIAGFTNFQF